MRTTSKPNTGKHGISTANAYRSGIKSPCTDLEGLIDAYGAADIIRYCMMIEMDIELYGDSIYNGAYNIELNMLPIPKIRKQYKSKAEQKALREKRAA